MMFQQIARVCSIEYASEHVKTRERNRYLNNYMFFAQFKGGGCKIQTVANGALIGLGASEFSWNWKWKIL